MSRQPGGGVPAGARGVQAASRAVRLPVELSGRHGRDAPRHVARPRADPRDVDRGHRVVARSSGRSSRSWISSCNRSWSGGFHKSSRGIDRGPPLVRDSDHGGPREQGALADRSGASSRIARPAEERAIRQALVPTQEVVEIKNGKKVNVERKMYPGYVLVEMVMNQETIHTVNGIQGVIKFVGQERAAAAAAAGRGQSAARASRRSRSPRNRRKRFRSSSVRRSRSPRDRSPISTARSKR